MSSNARCAASPTGRDGSRRAAPACAPDRSALSQAPTGSAPTARPCALHLKRAATWAGACRSFPGTGTTAHDAQSASAYGKVQHELPIVDLESADRSSRLPAEEAPVSKRSDSALHRCRRAHRQIVAHVRVQDRREHVDAAVVLFMPGSRASRPKARGRSGGCGDLKRPP
jgi:hypothetical protein